MVALTPTRRQIPGTGHPTSDLIFSEGSESFASKHVYRTTNGGTSWSSVSTGLSQANPVNTIVIDPANVQTVFIGCDVGIFRTDNAGSSWTAWDQGLPNCSVQDLELFAPQRLLRAATHGRSIWERPIDAATCPLVQLYVRDNVLDTGRTAPSPSGVVDPFDYSPARTHGGLALPVPIEPSHCLIGVPHLVHRRGGGPYFRHASR